MLRDRRMPVTTRGWGTVAAGQIPPIQTGQGATWQL